MCKLKLGLSITVCDHHQAKRGLEKRKKEHQRMVRQMDVDRSEIASHCHNKDHRMDWEGAKILTVEEHWGKRKTKEAIWSVRKSSFNRRKEIGATWETFSSLS